MQIDPPFQWELLSLFCPSLFFFKVLCFQLCCYLWSIYWQYFQTQVWAGFQTHLDWASSFSFALLPPVFFSIIQTISSWLPSFSHHHYRPNLASTFLLIDLFIFYLLQNLNLHQYFSFIFFLLHPFSYIFLAGLWPIISCFY